MERYSQSQSQFLSSGDLLLTHPHFTEGTTLTSLLNTTADLDVKPPLTYLPPMTNSLPIFSDFLIPPPPSFSSPLFSDLLLPPLPPISTSQHLILSDHELIKLNHTTPIGYDFINPLQLLSGGGSSSCYNNLHNTTPNFHLPGLISYPEEEEEQQQHSIFNRSPGKLLQLNDSHPMAPPPSSSSSLTTPTLDSILTTFDLSTFITSLTATNSLPPLPFPTLTPKKETPDFSSSYTLPSLPPSLKLGTKSPPKRKRKSSSLSSSPSTQTSPTPKRTRRQRIGDKMHRLSKLLPVDEKMDNATMLEEMYDYVKFLQAQILALKSMPVQASSSGIDNNNNTIAVGTDIGKLSRQQVLQILVNSPDVQRAMYSGRWVLVSAEQVGELMSKVKVLETTGMEFKI